MEQFCSDVNPSFGFGPHATRRCREDATWSTVDTSQCSIRPMQQSTIVVYSTYTEDNITNSYEIEQVSGYVYMQLHQFVNLYVYLYIAKRTI